MRQARTRLAVDHPRAAGPPSLHREGARGEHHGRWSRAGAGCVLFRHAADPCRSRCGGL